MQRLLALSLGMLLSCAKGTSSSSSDISALEPGDGNTLSGGSSAGGATSISGGATSGGGAISSEGGSPSASTGGNTTGGSDESNDGGSESASGGTGGTINTCSESPCKLVSPQCGCADDKSCTINTAGNRTCGPEGPALWGDSCSSDFCSDGLICIGDSATGWCAKFCADDNDCTAPGGLCISTLGDSNGNTVPDAFMCTDNCDPISNAGCISGAACNVYREAASPNRFFTTCSIAGTGQRHASCTSDADCAATFVCVNTGGSDSQCEKYCDVDNPTCPPGADCIPITVDNDDAALGSTYYGICY